MGLEFIAERADPCRKSSYDLVRGRASTGRDGEFQWDKMGNLIRLNERALPTAEDEDSFPFRTWPDLAACEDLPYTSFKLE